MGDLEYILALTGQRLRQQGNVAILDAREGQLSVFLQTVMVTGERAERFFHLAGFLLAQRLLYPSQVLLFSPQMWMAFLHILVGISLGKGVEE